MVSELGKRQVPPCQLVSCGSISQRHSMNVSKGEKANYIEQSVNWPAGGWCTDETSWKWETTLSALASSLTAGAGCLPMFGIRAAFMRF